MFFSEEAFNAHSVLGGNFEQQMKFNDYNFNEDKFDMVAYQKYVNRDEMKWYDNMLETLSEKSQKLRDDVSLHTCKKSRHASVKVDSHHTGVSNAIPSMAPSPSVRKSSFSEMSVINHQKMTPVKTEATTSSPTYIKTSESLISDVGVTTTSSQHSVSSNDYSPKSPTEAPSVIKSPQSPPTQKSPHATAQVIPKNKSPRANDSYQPGQGVVHAPPNRSNTCNVNRKDPSDPRNWVYPWSRNTKAVSVMKTWYPMRFKHSYPPPGLSSLNAHDQAEYLELHGLFFNRTTFTIPETKSYNKYMHFKTLINKERVEFMKFLEQYAKKATEDYEFMGNNQQYCAAMIQYSHEEASRYPDRYFVKVTRFPLHETSGTTRQQQAHLQFDSSLLFMGYPPLIIQPNLNNPYLLQNTFTQLASRCPISREYKSLSKPPLRNDSNVLRLVAKYRPDIVMTNSAFINLMYHLAAENPDDFKMPVVVQNVTAEDSADLKVMFIEKPFIPRYMSTREKMEKLYKRVLMCTLIKTARIKSTRLRGPQPVPTRQYNTRHNQSAPLEMSNIDYGSLNELESFGVQKQGVGAATHTKSKLNINDVPDVKSDVKLDNKSSGKIAPKSATSTPSSDEDGKLIDSEDDEEALMIVEMDKEEMIEKEVMLTIAEDNEDTPTSPKTATPASPEHEMAPASPDGAASPSPNKRKIDDDTFTFKPKVIPLDSQIQTPKTKNQKPEQEVKNASKVVQVALSVATKVDSVSAAKKPSTSGPSLIDLIGGLQSTFMAPMITTSTSAQPPPVTSKAAQTSRYKQPLEHAKDYEHMDLRHENVNYVLWTLNSQPPLKILVRASVDGFCNNTDVVLHSKLEYQPQFGCEKLSQKDYCQMWCKSYLRNYADVFLCRINVFTNKLIFISQIQHSDIVPANCGFNPNQSLNHLRNLLIKMRDLQPSSYLLSKEPNDDHITLLKSTPNKIASAFDLHFHYTNWGRDPYKPGHWLPVDPEQYLPYHRSLKRVPCLFEPGMVNKDQKSANFKAKPKPKGRKKRY